MITTLLRRLEMNPHATFSEDELAALGNGFEQAKRDGLLRSVGQSADLVVAGRVLTVIEDEDGLEAYDEADPAFDPVPVTARELRRWRVDLPALVARVRQENGLDGPSGELDPRLWLLGRDKDAAYVLALLHDPGQGAALLRSLPALVPGSAARYLTVCPTFELAPALIRELEALSVRLTRFDPPDGLGVQTVETASRRRFSHSPDYRSVVFGDREFQFSVPQAAVIAILDGARTSGAPDVPWNQVRAQLEASDAHPERMADVFKRVDGWNELVISPRRGYHRLAD